MNPGPLIAAGRTSDVYQYGAGAVVKVPRPGTPEHWSAMEAQFTEAVRALGVPAAEVLGVVEVDDRVSIVFEHIVGPSMWDRMVSGPSDASALGAELARIHHVIHAAGMPADVPGLIERVSGKVREVVEFDEDECDEACLMIERLPCGAALLHGDLHPGNVLMSDDGPIVIDWFDATIGHPVADVVRSSMLLRPDVDGGGRGHLPGADSSVVMAARESYLSGMASVLDVSDDLRDRWETITAASRLAEGVEEDRVEMLEVWRSRRRHQPGGATEPAS